MFCRSTAICLGLAALTAGLWQTSAPPAAAQSENDGVEVLERGPVHEAFADPLTDPKPTPIINQKVPAHVDEVPPDQRPEGANVSWIPGYWHWDDQANQFIWVSGLWRNLPPGRQWVPGYWAEAQGGVQWVPGYWNAAGQAEVRYLPQPPESIESGPSVAAPGDNYYYVPGCWVYQDNRYVWRAGFWNQYHAGWFWSPARYVWTPGGYIFIDGFWDWAPYIRGLLFAPVRFAPGIWGRPGWVYRPRSVLLEAGLIASLFIRPGWGNYYYGNYYGSQGFVPWMDYRVGRNVYDPLYSRYRLQYNDPGRWERDLRARYAQAKSNQDFRPRIVTAADAKANTKINIDNNVLVAPVTAVDQRLKLQKIAGQQVNTAEQFHQLRARRQQLDAQIAAKGAAADQPRSGNLELPKAVQPKQVQTPPAPQRPRVEPPVPRSEPGPAPKDKSEPKPKVEPKQEPKLQPRVDPKVQPKPELKAEPKAIPKAEPKVIPKAEPQPKAEPRTSPPAPRPAPKAVPAPKGKGKD